MGSVAAVDLCAAARDAALGRELVVVCGSAEVTDIEVEGIDITRSIWLAWPEKLQTKWTGWFGRRNLYLNDIFMFNVNDPQVTVFIYCPHLSRRHIFADCPVDPKPIRDQVCSTTRTFRSAFHPPIDLPGAKTPIPH